MRSQLSYRYLESLMKSRYSSKNVITDLKYFKDDVMRHHSLSLTDENYGWAHYQDFGDFEVEGSMNDRHIHLLSEMTEFLDLDLSYFRRAIVLDVGAASGGTSLLFAALGANEVVSVEPVLANILRINFLADSFGVRNIVTEQTKFEEFTTDRKFDIVNFCGMLYFIKEQREALKKIHNLLNPEGILLLESESRIDKEGYIPLEILKRWLEEAGFIDLRVKSMVRTIIVCKA